MYTIIPVQILKISLFNTMQNYCFLLKTCFGEGPNYSPRTCKPYNWSYKPCTFCCHLWWSWQYNFYPWFRRISAINVCCWTHRLSCWHYGWIWGKKHTLVLCTPWLILNVIHAVARCNKCILKYWWEFWLCCELLGLWLIFSL